MKIKLQFFLGGNLMKKYIKILYTCILLICLFYYIFFVILNIPRNKKIHSDTIKKYSADIRAKYADITKLDIYYRHGAIQFHYYLNNNSQELYNIFVDNYKVLFHDKAIEEIDDTHTMKAYIKIFFHIPQSNNQSYELLFKNTSQYSYYEWSVLENGIPIKKILKR